MRTGWEEVAEMLSRVSAASAGTDPWRSRRACAQAPGCVCSFKETVAHLRQNTQYSEQKLSPFPDIQIFISNFTPAFVRLRTPAVAPDTPTTIHEAHPQGFCSTSRVGASHTPPARKAPPKPRAGHTGGEGCRDEAGNRLARRRSRSGRWTMRVSWRVVLIFPASGDLAF